MSGSPRSEGTPSIVDANEDSSQQVNQRICLILSNSRISFSSSFFCLLSRNFHFFSFLSFLTLCLFSICPLLSPSFYFFFLFIPYFLLPFLSCIFTKIYKVAHLLFVFIFFSPWKVFSAINSLSPYWSALILVFTLCPWLKAMKFLLR